MLIFIAKYSEGVACEKMIWFETDSAESKIPISALHPAYAYAGQAMAKMMELGLFFELTVLMIERSSENFQTTFLGSMKIFRRPFADDKPYLSSGFWFF
ncbi:hypothetical protein HMPREF3156_01487 [Neisseria sp. HMSC06F02]|nr:hypothetical protein HMPREF3156_01487 [Neisseria sp. HMSC06F02]